MKTQRSEISDDPSKNEQIRISEVIQGVIAWRKQILWGGLVGLTTVAVWIGIEQQKFESRAAVTTAAASRSAGGIGSIASQLGIGVPNINQSGTIVPTADLLEELIKSDTLTKRILADSVLWHRLQRDRSQTPATMSAVEPNKHWRENILNRVEIETEKSAFTGSVVIRIVASNATSAHEINKSVIRNLNQYILDLGQNQALEEIAFIKSRISQRNDLLKHAENQMLDFLAKNRSYKESAALIFIHERLYRELSLHQSLLGSLQQAMEDASVRAARNTPVLTVLQSPTTPEQALPRKLILRMLVGAILGAVLLVLAMITITFVKELLAELKGTTHFGSDEESVQ